MSRLISISFDPATADQDQIHADVENLFAMFGSASADIAAAAEAQDAVALQAAMAGQTAPTQQAQAAALTATATATQQPAATGQDVDSTGLRWDARIHSTPAKKNADGTWRGKRNQNANLVAQVRAEQQGGATAGPGVATAATPTPTGAPSLQAPGALAPLAPLTQPQAPVVHSSFQKLAALIGEHLHSPQNPTGRLTDDWVKGTLSSWGVPGGLLQNVAPMPEDTVAQYLAAIKNALGVQ